MAVAKSTCSFPDCSKKSARANWYLCAEHRDTHKLCPRCDNVLPHERFGTRVSGGRTYLRSHCLPCHAWVIQNTRPRRKNPDGKKWCPRCACTYDIAEFTTVNGIVRGYCTTCDATYKREWLNDLDAEDLAAYRARKKASDMRHSVTRRIWNLKNNYNMTFGQYEKMLAEQNGVCKICHKPETAVRDGNVLDLSVDHDHTCCPDKARSCGKCIRGLICGNCNKGLGSFFDDITVMEAAIAYLVQTKPEAIVRAS